MSSKQETDISRCLASEPMFKGIYDESMAWSIGIVRCYQVDCDLRNNPQEREAVVKSTAEKPANYISAENEALKQLIDVVEEVCPYRKP